MQLKTVLTFEVHELPGLVVGAQQFLVRDLEHSLREVHARDPCRRVKLMQLESEVTGTGGYVQNAFRLWKLF